MYIITVDTNRGNEAVCCYKDKEKAHLFSLSKASKLKQELSKEFPWRTYKIYQLKEIA